MKTLRERDQARTVAVSWRTQVCRSSYGSYKRNRKVGDELAALDTETTTAAQIAEIVGHDSWCRPQKCDECDNHSWDVVQLGEDSDYESNTANVCAPCLRKALAMLDTSNF